MRTASVANRREISDAQINGGPRPLRICMLHYSDFRLDSRLQRQARALAEAGDEVHSLGLSGPDRIEVGDGLIFLHRVPARKPSGGALDYLWSYTRFFALAFRLICSLERSRKFDLVAASNMPNFLAFAGLLPKLRGAPVILDVHDTFPELFSTKFGLAPNHRLVKLIECEERWSTWFSDAVVTVTEEAGQRLQARGLDQGKRWVTMNSPDEHAFGVQRDPVQVSTTGPIRAVYHGGLAPRFGVETLVRAFGVLSEALPEATLDVYGSEEDNSAVSMLARELAPSRVHVAPRPTPFESIRGRLEGAHLGIVPTLHDTFTELLLPVKLLEYVHMGIPVVASRLPVVERYFSSDEIRFCEPGSPTSIAEAILDVRSNPHAATHRAARASRRLETIEWRSQRETWVSRVHGLVEQHARIG